MAIDIERLARSLHSDHYLRGENGAWRVLTVDAKNAYREWAERVAGIYDLPPLREGGDDHGE